MNPTHTPIPLFLSRTRARKPRAFSASKTPRIHLRRGFKVETGRSAPSTPPPTVRTMTGLATPTPP